MLTIFDLFIFFHFFTFSQMNRNALHLAALSGNGDIYRRLIELGFDSKSIDQKGKTAEHYLRNNAAISSTELSELLSLSTISANNSRTLGKLSKTTITSNVTGGSPTIITADHNIITNTGNTNVLLSSSSSSSSGKKLGAKPSRLPALPNKQQSSKLDFESNNNVRKDEDVGDDDENIEKLSENNNNNDDDDENNNNNLASSSIENEKETMDLPIGIEEIAANTTEQR